MWEQAGAGEAGLTEVMIMITDTNSRARAACDACGDCGPAAAAALRGLSSRDSRDHSWQSLSHWGHWRLDLGLT